MISVLLHAFKKALVYVKDHPQIFFALLLLLVIPLLFLYTGQQFLSVGKSNQDRLEKDKVGLLHDAFSSLLYATNFDITIAENEFSRIARLNSDIVDYKISKNVDGAIVPIVARNQSEIGVAEANTDLYINASLRADESVIFEYYEGNKRTWASYRAVRAENNELYFMYTKHSLETIDLLFKEREQKAYFSLVFVYFFLIALAYWHIKLTDYRYLYIKAQKSNEMKDLFTNMITHELRAPLTAIVGYASILSDKLQQEDQKVYAQRIKLSSERLIAIVTDLLDVARIQSGKLSVTNEEVNISEVITNSLNELRISASQKSIELQEEGTDKEHMALADAKRLQQAIINLVSNAIKYTEKGSITLAVEDKHAHIEIRVKDTGMGISAEDQKKLFAPFFRVNSARLENITGSGLGMWITKELIELMGGQIGVESIRGVGTQVVITIPKVIRIS